MSNDANQTPDTTVTEDLDAFSSELFGQGVQVSQEGQSVDEDTEQELDEGETEQVEEVVSEVEETEETEEEESVEEAPEQAKKKTAQDRINELVREREEAKREGDRKLDELRREFEDKLAKLSPQEEAKPAIVAGEPTPDDLNEDGTPKYDLGEFDPKYIRDLTKHTLEQERKRISEESAREAEQATQTEAQRELVTKWNEKVESTVTQHPDFMEKGQQLVNSFSGLDESYGMYLTNLLMSMDKGPEVLYYLANNPEEAGQIVNSGAQRATLALGRIEAKFLQTPQQQTPKAKLSKAPPPAPAQARARGSNGAFINVSPDTDDLEAFATEFFVRKK